MICFKIFFNGIEKLIELCRNLCIINNLHLIKDDENMNKIKR